MCGWLVGWLHLVVYASGRPPLFVWRLACSACVCGLVVLLPRVLLRVVAVDLVAIVAIVVVDDAGAVVDVGLYGSLWLLLLLLSLVAVLLVT